ncbi:hypothetical protein BDV19DRAFT_74790 [Aspergillus venezuelensis]
MSKWSFNFARGAAAELSGLCSEIRIATLEYTHYLESWQPLITSTVMLLASCVACSAAYIRHARQRLEHTWMPLSARVSLAVRLVDFANVTANAREIRGRFDNLTLPLHPYSLLYPS